jgi:pyrimidine deaminase RibD-like protein
MPKSYYVRKPLGFGGTTLTTLHVQQYADSSNPEPTFGCQVYTDGNYIRWQALRATHLEHAEAEAVQTFRHLNPISVNEINLVPFYPDGVG